MRKRDKSTPRLEMMEDRVVPSNFMGMNIPPSLTADFHKLGDDFKTDAHNIKNYVVKLNQNRPGQSIDARWGGTPMSPVSRVTLCLVFPGSRSERGFVA